MGEGLQKGLELINSLGASGELEPYHLCCAARADLLRRIGIRDEALQEYSRALSLTANAVAIFASPHSRA